MIESRKNPPPHIRSKSSSPDEIRSEDDFCRNSMADSGITTTPLSGVTVKGNSPL
jgi:hypothetical protein